MELLRTTTSLILLIVPLTIIAIQLLRRQCWVARGCRRLPPGPMGAPLLGSLPFLPTNNLHHYFANLAKAYGPIISLRIGTKLHVVISSPSLAVEVLKTHDTIFANYRVPVVGQYPTGGQSILWVPFGPQWRLLRKALVQTLQSTINMSESFRSLHRREMHRVVEELRACEGSAVDIRGATLSHMLNVILRMIWGEALEEEEEKGSSGVTKAEIQELVEGIFWLWAAPNYSDFFPGLAPLDLQGLQRRMKAVSARLDAILDPIISRRQRLSAGANGGSKNDLLQLMLDVVEEKDPQMALQITNVKALIMDVILAGTDTTTNGAEWAMSELVAHPEKMKKAQEEMDSVVGRDGFLEESDIPKLEYLNAVVKETLRLRPVAAILLARTPSETSKLGGYTIPKGASVAVNVWAIQRDPSVWEAPHEFRPERFLEQKGRWNYYGSKTLDYLPFGGGRRICAGLQLGERMVTYLLATLVHSFNWDLPHGASTLGDETLEFSLRRKDPLLLIPRKRCV